MSDSIDTGLAGLTVAVTEPEAPVEAAPEVQLPALAQMPEDWTLHKVAALVGDVAQNMYELPFILKKHNLTPEQYAILEKNEFFRRALEAEIITWSGANSIHKRLALEAAIAVETAMPTVAARLTKSGEALADVVSLLKVLSEIAGVVGAKAAAPGSGSADKIKITINLGGDITAREATPSLVTVQSQSEGSGAGPSLSSLIQAP